MPRAWGPGWLLADMLLDWASQGWVMAPSPKNSRIWLNCPSAEKKSRKTGAMIAGASTTGRKSITL